jgi:hypothetical protein
MTDATVTADRVGHRLLELSKNWAVHNGDVLQVVGTGQVISPGSFEATVTEEIVAGAVSDDNHAWVYLFTGTMLIASAWFLFSTVSLYSNKLKDSSTSSSAVVSDSATESTVLTKKSQVIVSQRRKLSQDDVVALSSAPGMSVSNNQIVTTPEHHSTLAVYSTEQSRKITVHRAREVAVAANIIDQVIRESGRSVDPSVSLMCAIEMHKTDRKLEARLQEERRRYMYDHGQRETDRGLSERQHQESLSAMKEDNGWSKKLVETRDMCFGSLITAMVRGVVLVAVSRALPFLLRHPDLVSVSTLMSLASSMFDTVS